MEKQTVRGKGERDRALRRKKKKIAKDQIPGKKIEPIFLSR